MPPDLQPFDKTTGIHRLTTAAISLPTGTSSERRLATKYRRHRWWLAEARLAEPTHRRILVIDGQLIGSTSLSRGYCTDFFRTSLEPVESRRLLARLRVDSAGEWVLKTGLFYDRQALRRYTEDARRRLMYRAGPLAAALHCRHHGLEGYLAAVALHGQPSRSASLSPAAYVQQIQAGTIDEPPLQAHLASGARVVAVVPDCSPPVAVVRWST